MSDKNDILEYKKLWRIKKTILELCHDRGYLVTQDELDESLDEFQEIYKSNSSSDKPIRAKLTMLFTHTNNADKMYVYFPQEITLRKSEIVSYCQEMQKENINRAIIIARDKLTPVAKRALTDFAPTFILEAFNESELLVNIMDHELVPKHIILTTEEKEKLFAKYNLSESLLMRIQSTDPVARYYGLKRGQVVKILRNSETAGRYVSYRLVC